MRIRLRKLTTSFCLVVFALLLIPATILIQANTSRTEIASALKISSVFPTQGIFEGGTDVTIDGVFDSTVNIVQIAAGSGHSLALDDTGKVYAWGHNIRGQLGDGGTTNQLSPIAVDTSGVLADKNIVQIAAGYSHSLALDNTGKVYAWGYNIGGQLGDGSPTNRLSPVELSTSGILNDKNIVHIAAGSSHSLVLDDDGRVYVWGFNGNGQLGDGSVTSRWSPVELSTSGILNDKNIVQIVAGEFHSLAIDDAYGIYAWGFNNYGQLGNGGSTDQWSPVEVNTSGALADKNIVQIETGSDHSLALDDDGKIYAWGRNNSGQLGDGSISVRRSPVEVNTSGALADKNIVQIVAGYYHSLALDDEGKIYAWGFGGYGQLGNGSTANQSLPVAVDTDPSTSALGYTPGNYTVVFDPDGTPTECINIMVVNTNTLTCTTKAHIAEMVDVQVSDSTYTYTLFNAFEYTGAIAPKIPGVPNTGGK